MHSRVLSQSVLFSLTLLVFASSARALEPDQIALVVNKNVPEGVELARFYAQSRKIPDNRVIELDLPALEQMPFDDYERAVADPVRQFLETNGLRQQVQCLVTFYGVPLRVAARVNTPEETAELARLRTELRRVQNLLEQSVERLEQLAGSVDPSFRPMRVQSADARARQADHATRALEAALQRMPDPARRQQLQAQVAAVAKAVSTPPGDPPSTAPTTTSGFVVAPGAPATTPAATSPTAVDPARLAELLKHLDDPAAREEIRTIARRTANPFAYERVVQEHIVHLTADHSDSAVDSELALLWLGGNYQRAGWQPNPLGYPNLNNAARPQVVMVMRLDAPNPEMVRRMIQTSIDVERDGLTGKFVVDSRGLPARRPDGGADGFGAFDERLRELATVVKDKTKLELVHDEKPDVLPPASVKDVALYCGWYSVGRYVPSMTFASGAVAYHVASYELTSLRDPTKTEWVRGLLIDGVAATLGPVAEPLLHAFPAPDDFFPLLMTGRLTLAEVYWRTTPLTSWKMSAIGDPLYTPFKINPALAVEDLPERLKAQFTGAAGRAQPQRPPK